MKKIIIAALFVLSFAFTVFGQIPTSNLSISGLKQEVTVRRDARSVPYIEAKNEADLYFAQGFETAKDRLWQMDLLRRVARGRLAEIFGKQALEQDKQWRRYGFSLIADESLKVMNPSLKVALEDYARGVNAYIATLDGNSMPVECKILQYKPEMWQASDTVVVGKVLAEALSSSWRNDLIRASLQNLQKDKLADLTNGVTPYDVILFGKDSSVKNSKLTIKNDSSDYQAALNSADKFAEIREKSLAMVGLFAEDLAASNNWVISGKRTLDGKPILANDPHLQAAAPGIWYLTSLSSPTVQTAGVTLPGVPGVVLGHNESIAWGATNVGPDVQDLYTETFNDKGEYKTPSGWMKPTVRAETIKFRKNPISPETETESFDVVETRNGIIITDEVGQKFALKWTARDPKNQEFEAFFLLNRAKNWQDFQNSLKTYGGATQNFIYADVKGNIGWIAAGRIPIRKKDDGSLPYDGSTADGDWVGMIPFAELPMLYNPPSGFIVTANQRIVGKDYKYQQVSRDFALPWRAKRIYELINANPKITPDNVADIQRDSMSFPHRKLGEDILKLLAASNETLSELRAWDGNMRADSRAALIVNNIRNCVADKIAEDNKPVPSWVLRERLMWKIIDEKPASWLPKAFASYTDLYKTCDTETRVNLTKQFGESDVNWTWGKVFKSNYPHPLAIVPLIGGQFKVEQVPINGSGTTPNVGSNVSMRLIASPANWDLTRHAIPLGQSGNPSSVHWKDQAEKWRNGTPQFLPFTKAAIEKATVETLVLQPMSK
jgi:penicillin G amidase